MRKLGNAAGLLLLLAGIVGSPATLAAAPRVEFELATEPGFPLGGERRWIEMLQDLPDIGIRVRPMRAGELPRVEARGSGFEVLGILSSQNKLHLKGGVFGLNDRAALGKWLDRLRSGGTDGVTAARGAFGLTVEQLTALHEALKPDVGIPTAGMSLELLVERVGQRTRVPVEVDPKVQSGLTQGRVLDELTKVSCGTALSAALRHQGLIVTIEQRQNRPSLRITSSDGAEEFWPVGFETEASPRASIPPLFKFLNVEINDTPLSDALAAIQPRLEAPVLLDHNSLAREGIELTEVKVNVPAGRTYYKRILDQVLSQAKLRSEIRIDEAGTAFLWITTSRR